jgi:hypothetical protein
MFHKETADVFKLFRNELWGFGMASDSRLVEHEHTGETYALKVGLGQQVVAMTLDDHGTCTTCDTAEMPRVTYAVATGLKQKD